MQSIITYGFSQLNSYSIAGFINRKQELSGELLTGGAFEHGETALVERVIKGVHEVDLDGVGFVRKCWEF